jgi:hypothetical protein
MKSNHMHIMVAGVILLAIAFGYYHAVSSAGSPKQVQTVKVNATVAFP